MKKRIGTKLYNTDNAVCILPEQNLYRAKHMRTYWIWDGGDQITPVSFETATEMINKYGADADKAELIRRGDHRGRSSVTISAEHAEKLTAYCKSHNLNQKKVIENFIDSLTK